GCGIGEEDLKRIVSPYVQVDSKMARHGGTGIGLAMCSLLVRAMGGELSIVSTIGKGSTFTVTLPNVKESESAPVEESPAAKETVAEHQRQPVQKAEPAADKPTDAGSPRRVLIVDDQKMNLMVLKAMLNKLGKFEIATAMNGKEALDILESSANAPFAIVLTDMWMPVMDGEGLVRAIRADEKLASLPVHVVTADVEMQDKYQTIGFAGILLKPVTVDKLKALMG
ncbi:MAG: response regulator, partial [Victivallales bacterium]|nr:response regulator [Victivallales bacterium]